MNGRPENVHQNQVLNTISGGPQIPKDAGVPISIDFGGSSTRSMIGQRKRAMGRPEVARDLIVGAKDHFAYGVRVLAVAGRHTEPTLHAFGVDRDVVVLEPTPDRELRRKQECGLGRKDAPLMRSYAVVITQGPSRSHPIHDDRHIERNALVASFRTASHTDDTRSLHHELQGRDERS